MSDLTIEEGVVARLSWARPPGAPKGVGRCWCIEGACPDCNAIVSASMAVPMASKPQALNVFKRMPFPCWACETLLFPRDLVTSATAWHWRH